MNAVKSTIEIRNAKPQEFEQIGQLMADVYSNLDGFPKPHEQPEYYAMLRNIGEFTKKPQTELMVAICSDGFIKGAVVYFGDMQYYGSGGTATQEKQAAGFRLLAVAHDARRMGIGKALTVACIEKARSQHQKQLVIHTTKAMHTAWKMYEALGFKRSEDLDFMQGQLPVYGFRLLL
jgi:ribosomal protein S18 acetylase RimI-like enzyme